jgi:hypothetical protein
MRTRPILTTLLACLFALVSAQAQYTRNGVVTLLAGGTNNIAATSTNTYTEAIDVGRNPGICLLTSFAGRDAGELVVTLVLKRSLNGSTLEDAQTYRVAVTASGTATVRAMTNLTVGFEQFLVLTAVENLNTNAITNLVVQYGYKR